MRSRFEEASRAQGDDQMGKLLADITGQENQKLGGAFKAMATEARNVARTS